MMPGLDNGPYAALPAIAYAALHSLWQGALIAMLAAVVLGALARRSAAARHVVGLACLVAMVAAAIVTFAVYRTASPPALAPAPSGYVGPVMLRGADWLVLGVPLAWLLGTSVMLARQLGGWSVVVRLGRRRSGALPRAWVERLETMRRALGISRVVSIRPAIAASPFTARIFQPVIWLPPALWMQLTLEQRDALLAHELAHVRRLDWLWNGLQSLVQAVLFFHPAAWWLNRRIRQDREYACDDLAVASCGNAVALAEGLAVLERHRSSAPTLALAAQGGSLLHRVARLLAGSPVRVGFRAPIGLAILLASGTALAAHIDLPNDVLIDVRVDGSMGPLTPGAFREITADALNAQRYYRASMDHTGRLVEIYEVDGEPSPIDPGVRAWLSELPAR